MNKKVLVIDDSKTLRMLVNKHLAPFGVQTLHAENGEQGIARARELAPDAILLDYNMPVMDGYHALVELKTDPALEPIPVVMLTTETIRDTVIKLMKLGLKDYIAKPFTREVLLKKLNPILGLYDGDEVPAEAALVAAPEAAGSGANEAKPTILAIDDKPNILELLKEYLGDQFNILTADCGRAASSVIAKNRFDYLFLDTRLPDVSGFSIFEEYIRSNRNKASGKRVAIMTLRTAQEDIDRALGMGINTILYKPFAASDVTKAVDQLMSRQEESYVKKIRYLAAEGKVRILDCPPEKSTKFRSVAGSLASDVVKEIDDMAEEGLSQLIIKIGEGFLSDISVTRKFVDLVDHARQLSLRIRFVADSDQARNSLKQFSEIASVPTDDSLETALNAVR